MLTHKVILVLQMQEYQGVWRSTTSALFSGKGCGQMCLLSLGFLGHNKNSVQIQLYECRQGKFILHRKLRFGRLLPHLWCGLLGERNIRTFYGINSLIM